MKVTTISHNLFQLTHLGFVNCYLLREEEGFTLIDTSWPAKQGEVVLREARKLGVPVVRILLTHAHMDHVAALDALHEALPEAQVAISARDARFLAGDMSLDASEPQVPLRGGYVVCATKPTLLLHEGERVGSLEAVATPGHTPGHMAFLDIRDRTVIAGDAFQTLGGVAVSGVVKPFFPLPAFATWDKGLCLESARKLLALQPSTLLVGHGRALPDPQLAMQRAIQVMERTLAKEERKVVHGA